MVITSVDVVCISDRAKYSESLHGPFVVFKITTGAVLAGNKERGTEVWLNTEEVYWVGKEEDLIEAELMYRYRLLEGNKPSFENFKRQYYMLEEFERRYKETCMVPTDKEIMEAKSLEG